VAKINPVRQQRDRKCAVNKKEAVKCKSKSPVVKDDQISNETNPKAKRVSQPRNRRERRQVKKKKLLRKLILLMF